MIKRFIKYFHFFPIKSNNNILYFCWHSKCVVTKTYDLLKKTKFLNFKHFLLIENYLTIIEKINIFSKKKQNLVIFAHQQNKESGICLHNKYWKSKDLFIFVNELKIKPKIIYGHICWGSEILKQDDFMNTFCNWVSFKEEIWSFFGPPRSEVILEKIYKDILKEITNLDDVNRIKINLIKIFEKHMDTIYKDLNKADGDQVHIINLQQMINKITTSKEI